MSIACIFTGVAVSGVWSGINGMTLVTLVTHSTWSFALIGRYDLLLCYYWLVQCISLFKLADETVYFIYMQFVFWWRAIRSGTHNSLVTQFGGKFKFTFNHCSQVTIKEQHLSIVLQTLIVDVGDRVKPLYLLHSAVEHSRSLKRRRRHCLTVSSDSHNMTHTSGNYINRCVLVNTRVARGV